ncbi:MAG: hypothetical protein IJ809_06205 [Clostridia bacterium]|nr:hypothetical protein [Clostridia bacterium]
MNEKIHQYLYSKLDNFNELNIDDRLMLFVAEAFENSNIINGSIYSSMIEVNSRYVKIRKIKFSKNDLKKVFDIIEYGDMCKLVSTDIDIFSSIC